MYVCHLGADLGPCEGNKITIYSVLINCGNHISQTNAQFLKSNFEKSLQLITIEIKRVFIIMRKKRKKNNSVYSENF